VDLDTLHRYVLWQEVDLVDLIMWQAEYDEGTRIRDDGIASFISAEEGQARRARSYLLDFVQLKDPPQLQERGTPVLRITMCRA
jgi:hypothetical protein